MLTPLQEKQLVQLEERARRLADGAAAIRRSGESGFSALSLFLSHVFYTCLLLFPDEIERTLWRRVVFGLRLMQGTCTLCGKNPSDPQDPATCAACAEEMKRADAALALDKWVPGSGKTS